MLARLLRIQIAALVFISNAIYSKKPKLSKLVPPSHDSDRDDFPRHDLYGEDGRTDYSKSRLRQHREQRSSVNWAQLDDET